MLFKSMENVHLYFPLTSEQPETHLLQNHQQYSLGRPGRGGELSSCQPSRISFHLTAQWGTRAAVSCVFEPQQLSSNNEGRFPHCVVPPVLSIPPGLTGCLASFAPAP